MSERFCKVDYMLHVPFPLFVTSISLPQIQFRVLIIGRADSSKTSVLQRVCGTTESPIISRKVGWGKEPEEAILDPSMDVSEQNIDDELVYCIPMDNQRPQLDLKFYKDIICPDRNVPIIAGFLDNVAMDVADYPMNTRIKAFQEHYLDPLGDDARFVGLENMHKEDSRCNDFIEKTATAWSEDAVALILFAVQRDNVKLCVKAALNR
ncbi:hypothetical protein V8E53_004148 [Lactarius tabidus]